MMITLKLYAGLKKYLPSHVSGSALPLDVDSGSTPAQVLASFNIPVQSVHLLMINGVYIAPELRAQYALKDHDVIAVWPAVAGG